MGFKPEGGTGTASLDVDVLGFKGKQSVLQISFRESPRLLSADEMSLLRCKSSSTSAVM